MTVRSFARKTVPARVRVRRKLILRRWADHRAGLRFATVFLGPANFSFEWSSYELPFIDYLGQEVLGAAKRANQALLASFLDGVVIASGEVFSVWKLAPIPDARHGYATAAALREGVLTTEAGGAICLLSTVLYNAGLLAGMDIVERHCHSVDSYGENRYFELGRDAAIEFGHLDLRFRNPHTEAVQLRVGVTQDRVSASIHGVLERQATVSFDVSDIEQLQPLPGDGGRFRVHTSRTVETTAGTVKDDLGWSGYRVPPAGVPIRPRMRA